MNGPECKSYIVPEDCGLAPNPFGDTCTLAVCKPYIRLRAQPDDWIIGLTPRALGFNLVYAMQVDEVMRLGEYFRDPRFAGKKPDFLSSDRHDWMGDNFYEETAGGYIQHVSAHNIRGRPAWRLTEKAVTDLKGVNVVISARYFYYGENFRPLPESLGFLRVGRFHRSSGPEGARLFEKHAGHLIRESGIHGEPRTIDRRAQMIADLHNTAETMVQRGRQIVVFKRTSS